MRINLTFLFSKILKDKLVSCPKVYMSHLFKAVDYSLSFFFIILGQFLLESDMVVIEDEGAPSKPMLNGPEMKLLFLCLELAHSHCLPKRDKFSFFIG